MGDHVHTYGVDCSAWGGHLTSQKYLLNLRGGGHGSGIESFTVNGMRVEAKSQFAGLLYSEWGDGNVTIECDWSSQVWAYTYKDIIWINLGNSYSGAIYHFHDSSLAGGVKVSYGSNTWQFTPQIYFSRCSWWQRLTPSEVVSYESPSNNGAHPLVHFEGCRASQFTFPITITSTTSIPTKTVPYDATVWGVTIGYNTGQPIKSGKKRQLIVQNIFGNLYGAEGSRIASLPVGTLITGVRAVAPASSINDTDGGSFTVKTNEAVPVTVGTATVLGRSQMATTLVAMYPSHSSVLLVTKQISSCLQAVLVRQIIAGL